MWQSTNQHSQYQQLQFYPPKLYFNLLIFSTYSYTFNTSKKEKPLTKHPSLPSPFISPYSYTFNTNNTCSFPSRFHCRSSFILFHLFHPIHHLDPLPLSTTPTVLNRILISIPIFQFLTYSISSFTTSSKSVISLLPLTCHIPVSPGFTASLPR